MLRSHLFVLSLVGISAVGIANAQDPDAELRAHQERSRQRQAERLRDEWKGLPPAEIQRRQQIESLLQSSIRRIDGNQTPELVPYHIRMQHFFAGYQQGMFANMLAAQLSPADHVVLKEFAGRHREELQKASDVYERDWLSIAAGAQSMSSREIASAVKAATDRSDARLTSLYREVVGRLSSAGRGLVNEFAFINVRPQVSIEDPFVLATGDPEFYKDQVVKTYEMVRTGVRPAPPRSHDKSIGVVATDSTSDGQIGRSPP